MKVPRRILPIATFAVLAAFALVVSPHADASAGVTVPPANAPFDYQIGGAYQPPAGVRVVSRDRTAAPAPGLYNICYINAFQSQPIDSEIAYWRQHGLVLKNAAGKEVVDGNWNEMLLDIRTAAKRRAVAAKINEWIDGCAAAGYQALEPDNLDSFSRSDGLISPANAVEFIKLLVAHAHSRGLAIAQKNAIGSVADGGIGRAGRDAGLDFAVAEECGQYSECGDYTDLYGDHVIVIEYTSSGFKRACKTVGARLSVVRRDVSVRPRGTYQAC